MTASSLLDTLKVRGVTVRADGDVLKIKPFSALTDADRATIRQHKAAILELLETASRIAPATAPPAADETETESTPEFARPVLSLVPPAAGAEFSEPEIPDAYDGITGEAIVAAALEIQRDPTRYPAKFWSTQARHELAVAIARERLAASASETKRVTSRFRDNGSLNGH